MTSLAGSTVHFVAKPLFRPAVISDALRTLVERVRSAPERNAFCIAPFLGNGVWVLWAFVGQAMRFPDKARCRRAFRSSPAKFNTSIPLPASSGLSELQRFFAGRHQS